MIEWGYSGLTRNLFLLFPSRPNEDAHERPIRHLGVDRALVQIFLAFTRNFKYY